MSGPQGALCNPQGALAPWMDDRARTCTVCSEFVDVRATADGSDWCAIDANGRAADREPLPELCPCIPLNSGLRAMEHPRFYGPGLPSSAWFGGYHVHNGRGAQDFYLEPSALPTPCGHRLPPRRRTAPAKPPVTTQEPPECHGWPMRWAPRGWQCRIAGTYFAPTPSE